jgi:curved DNA-binding protein CbpA
MKSINEAYAVLSDQKKRAEYDAMRQQFGDSAAGRFRNSYTEQDIFRGSDIQQIFEEVARSFGLRGVDEIFKDFYGPGYRTYSVKKPGFLFTGFMFTGGLRNARKGLPLGNAMANLPRMMMKLLFGTKLPEIGADITDTIRISAELARQGGPYAYFHRKQSKKLVVKIPAGTRNDQKIRLSGMGEAGKDGGAQGHLYLQIKIKIPLGQRLKQLISGAPSNIIRKP